jgi:hypothetical protein
VFDYSFIAILIGYLPLGFFLYRQRAQIKFLSMEIERISKENMELNAVVKSADRKYRTSLESELSATRTVTLLNEQIWDLQRDIAQLQRKLEKQEAGEDTKSMVVLGIWPEVMNCAGVDVELQKLDIESLEVALYNSGVHYIPLTGKVDQRRILQQLRWNPRVTVLEIDAHGFSSNIADDGVAGGICLSDGVAKPGWWLRLVRNHKIEIVVLMACESEEVGRAIAREGVPHVICVMNQILDSDAIKFAIAFYESLAEGLTVSHAVDSARMEIDYRQAQRIVYISR